MKIYTLTNKGEVLAIFKHNDNMSYRKFKEICVEANNEADNVKGIGVDMPMSYLAKDHIITSALKNVGEGLKLTIKDYVQNNFNGGNEVKYDLTNGGVGYEVTDHLPQEVIDFVESKINSK